MRFVEDLEVKKRNWMKYLYQRRRSSPCSYQYMQAMKSVDALYEGYRSVGSKSLTITLHKLRCSYRGLIDLLLLSSDSRTIRPFGKQIEARCTLEATTYQVQ